MNDTILIIDDDKSIQRGLGRYFGYKYNVIAADNGAQGMAALGAHAVDCVILDIKMKGLNGFETYDELKTIRPDIPIIFYTGFQDEHDIKRILNQYRPQGYFAKGEDIASIEATIKEAVAVFRQRQEVHRERHRLEKELDREKYYTRMLNQKLNAQYPFDALRGGSPKMIELREMCKKAVHSNITVCIQGETGTGKELVANVIHSNSNRKNRPLFVQNCAAVPEHLFESEFFGHKKGAFTGALEDKKGFFEQAHRATVFLDEIGDLSLPMQSKLLRLLQEGEVKPVGSNLKKHVDVRVITATNKSLEEEVKAGRFREDLYYRLRVFTISPPALRQIREDIPVLARFLLRKFTVKHKKSIHTINAQALCALMNHPFPGNVRELENEIERAVVMANARDTALELHHFSHQIRGDGEGDILPQDNGMPLKEQVKQFEKRLIKKALARYNGNKTLASRHLGISRVGLNNKIKRYAI